METPKTEISYDIICDKMPQSHYSTYELAVKWAKSLLTFDEPVYIVKRTTTYEICSVIDKRKKVEEGRRMKMAFDEEGLLDEPCLSCDKAYVENIWHEWCCDEKECQCKAESEDKE